MNRQEADERLRRGLKQSLADPVVYAMFERHTLGSLTHLGVDQVEAKDFLRRKIQSARIPDLYDFEAEIHAELTGLGAYTNLEERLRDRSGDWFRAVEAHVRKLLARKRGLRILDYGGGSGELAMRLAHMGCEVTIADVLDWRNGAAKRLPFIQVKSDQLAFDEQFDLALVVTVWHHALDVSRAINLVASAAPEMLVIESVTNSPLEFKYAIPVDHVYNRWYAYNPIPEQKILVPCHFDSSHGWENRVWMETARKAVVSQDLGIYMNLNPEHHHLFVFA